MPVKVRATKVIKTEGVLWVLEGLLDGRLVRFFLSNGKAAATAEALDAGESPEVEVPTFLVSTVEDGA